MPLSAERKAEYFDTLKNLLSTYSKLFIVEIDNVGSKQLQDTRKTLRGKAEVLMGKNTMMRKCLKEYVDENPGSPVEKIIDCCRGNVGFVFTNGDLGEIREVLESNTRPAPAKVGSIAPSNVVVPKGPTGCDPGQTGFFQTLQIATKITRGQIEMVNDTNLISAGDKVTASQAALLQKLDICPFAYGVVLKMVYDNGSLFDAKVLEITDDVLASQFCEALGVLASISLAAGYPTQASVPHSIVNAFKMVLSLTIECETYSFDVADQYVEYLKDPSKFAGPATGGGDAAAAEEEPEEEEEEEAEAPAGGGGLFGDDGGDGDY
jgi:large subunit ribosomal protein LP0